MESLKVSLLGKIKKISFDFYRWRPTEEGDNERQNQEDYQRYGQMVIG